MTEDFKKWVDVISENKFPGSYENAAFWVKLVFEEIDKKSDEIRKSGDYYYCSNPTEDATKQLLTSWFISSEAQTESSPQPLPQQ